MKKKITGTLIISLLGFLVLTMIFPACEREFSTKPFYEDEAGSISDYILARPDSFSRFGDLMKTGELERTLTAYNPHGNNYTVFLPLNKAFDGFLSESPDYESFNDLLDDQQYVRELVRYHVVNRGLERKDFPFGALPDTTLSGDLLTIGFTGELDSTVQQVNSYASIVQADIELANGYVHVIDEVLRPITFSSYEWLTQHQEYSLFTQALEVTGLKDTFLLETGQEEPEYSSNTLFVESDEVFSKQGIHSIEDLKQAYSPNSQNYTDYSNGLYQFMAYHIMEGKQFLNNFEGNSTNFNTYAYFPVSINATGIDIKINQGAADFDTLVSGGDTTVIDYIRINYDRSNVTTKNGAVHFIEDVMELYRPNPSEQTFQFYEEPLIDVASNTPDTYIFEDTSEFEVIKWEGVEELTYLNSSNGITGVWNNDYLELNGDFSITYQMPKVLPGVYMLRIRANDDHRNNATIQVYLDGRQMGGNIDLTKGDGYNWYDVGLVNFLNYQQHELKIETLISGRLIWDAVQFAPN